MESTGRPGWIHASEQTAAELQAQGQHHWLHARADQVLAKGLGELSTYWIVMPKGSRWGSLSTDDDDDDDKNQPSRDELVVEVEEFEAAVVTDVSISSVRSANRSVQVHC
jgi:hypothetical protein